MSWTIRANVWTFQTFLGILSLIATGFGIFEEMDWQFMQEVDG